MSLKDILGDLENNISDNGLKWHCYLCYVDICCDVGNVLTMR